MKRMTARLFVFSCLIALLAMGVSCKEQDEADLEWLKKEDDIEVLANVFSGMSAVYQIGWHKGNEADLRHSLVRRH